eukprot:4896045-Pyramimonas_sp.AAC.1
MPWGSRAWGLEKLGLLGRRAFCGFGNFGVRKMRGSWGPQAEAAVPWGFWSSGWWSSWASGTLACSDLWGLKAFGT